MQISTIPRLLSVFYAWITDYPVFPVPNHCYREDAGLWRMDGQIVRGEERKDENTPGPRAFKVLLQPPLIDGSTAASLNTALISGSKQNIWKASSCWVKPWQHCSLWSNNLFLCWFSSPFFLSSRLSIFCTCFFFCCPLFYVDIFVLLYTFPLCAPFVCLLCTQKIHHCHQAVRGPQAEKKQTCVRGHKEEKKWTRIKNRLEFLTVTTILQETHMNPRPSAEDASFQGPLSGTHPWFS